MYDMAIMAANARPAPGGVAGNPSEDRATVIAGDLVAYGGPERRDRPRAVARLAGKLISADGFLHPDCTVLDLSVNGARVQISAIIRLPPPAALLLVDEGLLFDAAIAWRRGNETGLVFTSRHDLSDGEPADRPGLRDLWMGWLRARASSAA
jgi:hypothetical protein